MPDYKIHKPQDADLSNIQEKESAVSSNVGRGADIYSQRNNAAKRQEKKAEAPAKKSKQTVEEREEEFDNLLESKEDKKIGNDEQMRKD